MPKAQPSVLTFILNKLALFAPFTLLLWSSEHHPHLWRLRVRTACRVPLTTPLFNRQSGGFFIKFLKRNIVVPRVISRIAQICFIPHQGLFMCLCFSILLLMALFGGYVGMEDKMANLLLI